MTAPQTLPIVMTVPDTGGMVSGRVLQADGTAGRVRLACGCSTSSSARADRGRHRHRRRDRGRERALSVRLRAERSRHHRQAGGHRCRERRPPHRALPAGAAAPGAERRRGAARPRHVRRAARSPKTDARRSPVRCCASRARRIRASTRRRPTPTGPSRSSRIPVGNVLIEAVNVVRGAQVFVSERIPVGRRGRHARHPAARRRHHAGRHQERLRHRARASGPTAITPVSGCAGRRLLPDAIAGGRWRARCRRAARRNQRSAPLAWSTANADRSLLVRRPCRRRIAPQHLRPDRSARRECARHVAENQNVRRHDPDRRRLRHGHGRRARCVAATPLPTRWSAAASASPTSTRPTARSRSPTCPLAVARSSRSARRSQTTGETTVDLVQQGETVNADDRPRSRSARWPASSAIATACRSRASRSGCSSSVSTSSSSRASASRARRSPTRSAPIASMASPSANTRSPHSAAT